MASGSPPPARAAMPISRATLVKTAPRLASLAPFWRLICGPLGVSGHRRLILYDGANVPTGPESTASPRTASGRHPEDAACTRRAFAPAQRRPGGSRRFGQDHAGRAPPPHDRRHPRAWAAWTTGRPASTSSRRSRSGSCRCRWRSATLQPRRPSHHAHRHARVRGLRGRGLEGFAAARRGAHHDGCVGRRRGGHRDGHRPGPARSAPRTLRAHQVRPGERRPVAAALDVLRAEFGNKIAPLQVAIGKAESFRGYVDVVHGKAWCTRAASATEVPHPRRACRRGRAASRPAAGGGRGGRRRRPDQVPGGRGGQRRGAGGVPPHGGPREHPGARAADLGRATRSASTGLLDAIVALPAPPPTRSRRSPRSMAPGKEVEVVRPGRSAAGPGVQDHRRPVRRAADLLPGLVGHDQVARPRLERRAGRGGADRPGAAAPRQGPEPAGEIRRARSAPSPSCPTPLTGDTLSTRSGR